MNELVLNGHYCRLASHPHRSPGELQLEGDDGALVAVVNNKRHDIVAQTIERETGLPGKIRIAIMAEKPLLFEFYPYPGEGERVDLPVEPFVEVPQNLKLYRDELLLLKFILAERLDQRSEDTFNDQVHRRHVAQLLARLDELRLKTKTAA
jgi:hypothetical protein